MTEQWTIDLLSGVYGGNISPANVQTGTYNPTMNSVDGTSLSHGGGEKDFFYKVNIPIEDFTVHALEVTVEWNRIRGEGGGEWDDVVLQMTHPGISPIKVVSPGEERGTQVVTKTFTKTLRSGTIIIQGRLDDQQSNASDYLRCTSIRLTGSGPIPFGAPDEHWTHSANLSECPIVNVQEAVGGDPINLRTAEKIEAVTDIALSTPFGLLTFTRTYQQSRNDYDASGSTPLDVFLTPLGLGWTHNHDMRVFSHTSYSDKLLVKMPKGGIAHFTWDATESLYLGDPGSNSKLDDSGGTDDKYTLTASDESVYVFDNQGYIRSHTLPNGESWTYTYSSGKLSEVTDGYGHKLVFRYYTSGDHTGQLRFVGDQTFDDSFDTDNPDGRYVEYRYLQSRLDGTVTSPARSLLHEVFDVYQAGKALLDKVAWHYDYYGQEVGEDDSNLTNYLIRYTSPEVDLDGDDEADEALVVKQLAYASNLATIDQKRGKRASDTEFLTETQYRFYPTEGYTEEETGERVTTHFFNTADIYVGIQNPAGDFPQQRLDDNYRIVGQADGNDNATRMAWDNDGKLLSNVTNALNHETSFTYDSQDRLQSSVDATGRVTTYLYDADRRQPSSILVADTEGIEKAVNGDMENNSDWSPVGTLTQNRSNANIDAGAYAWYVDAGQDEGIESTASLSLAADKTYLISARVYVDSGAVRMKMSGTSDFDAVSQQEDEWESLLAIHTPSSASTPKLQFLADGGSAVFYVDSVHVVEIEELHRWQHYAYDDKGRTLLDALINTQNATFAHATQRVYGSSGNAHGLLQTLKQINVVAAGVDESTLSYDYDSQGRLIKTTKTSLLDECCFTYIVYDAAGNVLGSATARYNNATDSLPIPSTVSELLALYNASHDKKKHTRITTHTYDALGRRVSTTVNAGTSFARTSRTIYNALSQVVRVIDNYVVQGLSKPGNWVWRYDSGDQQYAWRLSDTDATVVSHGTDNTQNFIVDADYNKRGLLCRRRDVLGRVTLFGYDLADRMVKTVQNASQPDYDASYATGDPALSNYVVDGNSVEHDVISEQFYDTAGNLVKSIDARGIVNYSVFDNLNRQVKTVQSARDDATIDLNPGEAGYDPEKDPRSSNYLLKDLFDRDIIIENEYDAMGHPRRTRLFPSTDFSVSSGRVDLAGYDVLGRLVRRILSTWTAPDYNLDADPDLSEFDVTGGNTYFDTVYDDQGRVLETIDTNGTPTRYVYDGLNRLVMTIVNYVPQLDGSDEAPPETWYWNNGWKGIAREGELTEAIVSISHGSKNDENFIAQTIYNSEGQVQETRNVLGHVQHTGYDIAGRPVISVTNYVDNSYQPPNQWVYENGQWKDEPSGTTIQHGTDFDENIIASVEYDAEGRVLLNRDNLGNATRYVYDGIGRMVMTILNFTPTYHDGTQTISYAAPENWLWHAGNSRWEDGSGVEIRFKTAHNATENEVNRISHVTYDILGRVLTTRDVAGRMNYVVYDALGRRALTVANYVAQANPPEEWEWANNQWEDGSSNAIEHNDPAYDQNIIVQMVYNRAGQVVSTRDARGTQTRFTYDGAGRQQTVTYAADTALASTDYMVYYKFGLPLRVVRNWVDTGIAPDAVDENGDFLFDPQTHGYHHDENLITFHDVDRLLEQTTTALGPLHSSFVREILPDGKTSRLYSKDGNVTFYYDALGRMTLAIQNRAIPGLYEDGADVFWDDQDLRWEKPGDVVIDHTGPDLNLEQNIIVEMHYDIAGRLTHRYDPNGNMTAYEYDKLGRRTKRTNPLSLAWETAYSQVDGKIQTTMSYPNGYNVVNDFDRMGRLQQIDYGETATPYTTPTVAFTYDVLGNRKTMVENNGTADIRKTIYGYDAASRLNKVEFDDDGGGTVDDTIDYEYDVRGRRTKLLMPDNKNITYVYDEKGRLITLTDWDGNITSFAYDKADRHVRTRRSNGLDSLYQHDAAGRLITLHHLKDAADVRQSFVYKHGPRAWNNHWQAKEVKPRTSGAAISTMNHDYPALVYRGDWNDTDTGWLNTGEYHEASVHDASVSMLFYGDTATLTMGKNDNCSIFDVYIDGTLWLSFDGYAASATDLVIPISVEGTGLHLLEVKNRLEHNINSSGYKLRFKSLCAQPAFDVTTIDYTYDQVERLLEADYNNGERIYSFTHDLAGNRLSESLSGSLVTAKTTEYEYTPANQIERMRVDGGSWTNFTYDDNGNLTSDGVNTPTWDRANRLLSMGNNAYVYNGDGDRVQQTVSSIATNYLLDVQPGLTQVLAATRNSDITRYVHAVRGIHAQEDPSGIWTNMLQDGLGSVRSQINNSLAMVSTRHYAPYGEPYDTTGTVTTDFGYSGEMVDSNSLVYLRSRYYAPGLGVFPSLDRFEGLMSQPLTLNQYSYVGGNPINRTDPSGMFWNNVVGAGAGAIIGGLLGYTQATVVYNLAVAGMCDCATQQQALSKGQSAFTRDFALMGAFMGGVFGALVQTPFGGALATIMQFVGYADMAQKISGIWDDFTSDFDIDNWCPVAELVFDFVTDKLIDTAAQNFAPSLSSVDELPTTRRPDDIATPNRTGCSFSADTEVLTPDGLKPISEIQIGDAILGYNESTGEVGVFAVTATYTQHHETTLDLTIDGEVIHTTDEHPFYVKEQGWTEAGQLNIGDAVLRAAGSYGVVEAMTVIHEPQTMYNLTVALAHTFVVGDNGWVVHNTDIRNIIELFSGPIPQINRNVPGYRLGEARVISIDIRTYGNPTIIPRDAGNLIGIDNNFADEVFITNPFVESFRYYEDGKTPRPRAEFLALADNFTAQYFPEVARVLHSGGKAIISATPVNPFARVLQGGGSGGRQQLYTYLSELGFRLENLKKNTSPYTQPIHPALRGGNFGRPDSEDNLIRIRESDMRSISLVCEK